MAGAEVLREFLNWFNECGVNVLDADIPQPDDIDSFRHYLRDGVLVCDLINLLNSAADPSSQDLCQPTDNDVSWWIIYKYLKC